MLLRPTACTPATVAEMQTILGPELFGEFPPHRPDHQPRQRDYDHLVTATAQDHVIMNKHVWRRGRGGAHRPHPGNPYGGYSGGYKHCATGISHRRSISAHHVPR